MRERSSLGTAVAGVLVLALIDVACTTTQTVGRFEAPETQAQLADLMADSTVTAHIAEPPPASVEWGRFPVVGRSPDGLKLKLKQGSTLVAPLYVQSFAVRRHGRGALDGMLIGGAGGAVVGGLLGTTVRMAGDCATRGPCGGDTVNPGFVVIFAVLFGLLGAALGAVPGAAIGHTDEYVLSH